MTKHKRRTVQLLEMLQLHKRLDVRTVADNLNISDATVRRFFGQLEEEGKVIRVHGGVQLAQQLGYDYSFRAQAAEREEQKLLIANHAAAFVHDNEHIFLDSGTTTLKLAEALSVKLQTGELENIVVLTNSVSHIETVARLCKVILVGGEIRPERLDVCGSVAEKTLTLFHLEKAFFGADAISTSGGFMTTDERTSTINEIVVKRSNKAFVLADSTKFNKTSFIRYAAFNEVDTVITDAEIQQDTLRAFREAGARIEVVKKRK